jgi:plasmid maintenance system antidote protein VapI
MGRQINNKLIEIRPFNVKLQSRIRQLGFKNYQVAFACQIHEADFSRIINGRKKSNDEQKKKLCEFLKSSPEELDL